MAVLMDGRTAAEKTKARVAAAVREMRLSGRSVPGLAVILVGNDPASRIYVRRKRQACEEVGFQSVELDFPVDAGQDDVLHKIVRLNADPAVHGLLVQLPLPSHMDRRKIIEAVAPAKDVDGFHPLNAGCTLLGQPGFRPCTPMGIMELLRTYGIDCTGKAAVVVGRSHIVGRPMAAMLTAANATVTVCHSYTPNLEPHVSRADILVVAVGKAGMIPGAWVKPGSVVVDVGQNRQPDGTVLGDVEFEPASLRAGHITPVPGGVGPMTVAMLLSNTLDAALGGGPGRGNER